MCLVLSCCSQDTVTMAVQVNGKVRGTVEVSKDATQDVAVAAAQVCVHHCLPYPSNTGAGA